MKYAETKIKTQSDHKTLNRLLYYVINDLSPLIRDCNPLQKRQTSELKSTFVTERCCMEINTSVFLSVCLFFLNRYSTDDGMYSVYDKSVGFVPVIGNRSSRIPSQCQFSKFINDLSTTCCIWNFAFSITVGSDFKISEVFNIIQNRENTPFK